MPFGEKARAWLLRYFLAEARGAILAGQTDDLFVTQRRQRHDDAVMFWVIVSRGRRGRHHGAVVAPTLRHAFATHLLTTAPTFLQAAAGPRRHLHHHHLHPRGARELWLHAQHRRARGVLAEWAADGLLSFRSLPDNPVRICN